MNVREAAVLVLKEADAPLHAREIAKRVSAKKLWKTAGKTPHQTVSARLYADIKKNGGASPFVLADPQTFGVRSNAAAPSQSQTKKSDGETLHESSGDKYSFTDSAEKVLERFGDKRPMHYRTITEKALEMGWLTTEGRTPEASMYAQILTEIRRYQKRGEQPRFVQHG